jgi:DNA-3-methyladenine glycosylase I
MRDAPGIRDVHRASSFENAVHITNEDAPHISDQQAGSSPSGARSVANSIKAKSQINYFVDARARNVAFVVAVARGSFPRIGIDMMNGIVHHADGVPRCWWAGNDALYVRYHDKEWARPVVDDNRLFEKICLEGFQAGLSWLTILRKRDAFRHAFASFDIARVARFGARDVNRLLNDSSIVRHRGKIESAINNARCAEAVVQEYGSLAAYIWQWEPAATSRPRRLTKAALMELAVTPESKAFSKDLKRRGWTFVGPTTIYAFMQAMGLVNDHLEGCATRYSIEAARRKLVRPDANRGGTGTGPGGS